MRRGYSPVRCRQSSSDTSKRTKLNGSFEGCDLWEQPTEKKSFLLIAEGSYLNILLVLNWFYDFFIKSVKSDQFSTL